MALSVPAGNRESAGPCGAASLLSVPGGFYRTSDPFSGIFRDVLEFLYSDFSHAVGAASYRRTGGLGICPSEISRPERDICLVCIADGIAVSGDPGIELSGAGLSGAFKFSSGIDSAGNLVNLSGIHYDTLLLNNSVE